MSWQKTLDHVRRIILESRPSLHPSQVIEASSLTGDLDLNPWQLEQVLSRLQSEQEGRPFTPWYLQALRPGQDTVGSLVDFLLKPRASSSSAPQTGLKAA